MALTHNEAEWIQQHLNDDVAHLRLRHAGDERMAFLILQVECRRKTVRKLPEELESPYFIFPTRLSAEQCSADSVARYHASLTDAGWAMADLTAGLGIDAMHMAGRVASVLAIERDPALVEALDVNRQVTGHGNLTPMNADCEEWLNSYAGQRLDAVFIDPARRGDVGQRVYGLQQCTPDVVSLLPVIRKVARRLIVKASPMLDITQTWRDMPGASDIYAVGTADECKEVAVKVEFDRPEAEPHVHAVTLTADGISDFCFTLSEEQNAAYAVGSPLEGGYLYEPYPAVMKAGAYKLLCERTGCKALHANTHLYVSDVRIADFPGDVYKIARVIPWASKEIKALAAQNLKASVSVRNFKMPAEKVKAKLKCGESSERRLIVTTAAEGPIMILCERIIKS